MFAKSDPPVKETPVIAVLGAAGTQAEGFLDALDRAREDVAVVAVDRRWEAPARQRVEALGCTIVSADIHAGGEALRARLAGVALVVSFIGPFDAVGTVALELAIELGARYLDICDDLDATAGLLALDARAKEAGTVALVGMGSAPGMTNVLARLGLDALGDDAREPEVRIRWVADGSEMNAAIFEHVVHCFTAVAGDGAQTTWADLGPELLEFPAPVGLQEVVTMGHPEVLTIPRFTRAARVTNKGGSAPSAYMHLAWTAWQSVARGADVGDAFQAFAAADQAVRRLDPVGGSALMVDVVSDGRGYRFASGSASTSMADATGIPAAAGALALLDGGGLPPGVWAPECLDPGAILAKLARVSLRGGDLKVFELRDGVVGEPLRLRDLLQAGSLST